MYSGEHDACDVTLSVYPQEKRIVLFMALRSSCAYEFKNSRRQRVGYVYQVSITVVCKISVPNHRFIVVSNQLWPVFCKMTVPYH